MQKKVFIQEVYFKQRYGTFFRLACSTMERKIKMLDKFEDERLVAFGKKIIYQEAPDVLPQNMFKSIKKGIAKGF